MGSLEDDRVSIIPNEEGNVVAITKALKLYYTSALCAYSRTNWIFLTYKQPFFAFLWGKKLMKGALI